MANRFFNQSDMDRISAAVREAEKKTSGEIVPYLVEKSDDYEEAMWRGGALLAFAVLTIFALVHLGTDSWSSFGSIEVILSAFGAIGAGMLAVSYIQPVKRFLAGNELIEQRVAQRAAQAFIAEEVFHTRDRTGILIFISLLERRVLVVGDSGINAKVDQSEWENVAGKVVAGIRVGRAADGLIEAIHECGVLLQKHGVRRRRDDRDELSNKLRTERRRKK